MSMLLQDDAQSFDGLRLDLGRTLFSDPQRERSSAIVVVNHPDETAQVEAGDLLNIDFTDTAITEGLYVITLDDQWIGYRFFQRTPYLEMRDSTSSYPVTDELLSRMKVVGRVLDVYRSTQKEMASHD